MRLHPLSREWACEPRGASIDPPPRLRHVGEDVRLRCEAVGGRPLARVTWWRDHALLDDSFQVERDKVGRKFSSE